MGRRMVVCINVFIVANTRLSGETTSGDMRSSAESSTLEDCNPAGKLLVMIHTFKWLEDIWVLGCQDSLPLVVGRLVMFTESSCDRESYLVIGWTRAHHWLSLNSQASHQF